MERVRGLADASISIVRGNLVRKDVMQIEVLADDENGPTNIKPVYALGSFEWSTFSEAFNQRDSYWYLSSLRDYATFLFNAFSNKLTWNCSATLIYSEPCTGCSNCYIKPHEAETKKVRRWWSSFIPSFQLGSQARNSGPDLSKVINKNCSNQTEIECDSAGYIINTSNIEKNPNDNESGNMPKLYLKVIKPSEGFSFISDSWRRINTRGVNLSAEYPVRAVVLRPKLTSAANEDEKKSQERFFYIDNESYEVKSIRVTLLPKFLNVYAPSS